MELLKKHLVIESDYTDEDTLLTLYGNTAEESVEKELNRTWDDVREEYGSVPASLQSACLFYAAHLYRVREPVASVKMEKIPQTFDALWKPYAILAD